MAKKHQGRKVFCSPVLQPKSKSGFCSPGENPFRPAIYGKKLMGDTELESVTSTMSTSERSNENAVNCGADELDREPLHQWLHQMAKQDDQSVIRLLVELLTETLGADAMAKLDDALRARTA